MAADRHYVGLITKNPMHPHWRVEWRRDEPYTLPELADWLFPKDMQPDPSVETTFGVGRNVTVFDELRLIAYREVWTFKRTGSLETFRARLERVAIGINMQFRKLQAEPKPRAIVEIVAEWTRRHRATGVFQPQPTPSGKARRRTLGHHVVLKTRPAKSDGIPRPNPVSPPQRRTRSPRNPIGYTMKHAPHKWSRCSRTDGFRHPAGRRGRVNWTISNSAGRPMTEQMHFIVENEALAKALVSLNGIVRKVTTIPILDACCSGDCGRQGDPRPGEQPRPRDGSAETPAEVMKAGAAALPGERLQALAKRLTRGGQCEVSLVNDRAHLVAGSSRL